MAKIKRVSFSGKNLGLLEIDQYYKDTESSLRFYFNELCPQYELRFSGLSNSEVSIVLEKTLSESERAISMNVLSALEAAFRIDYLQRSYARKKDRLSVAMRKIYLAKGNNASLEDDIFQAWKNNVHGVENIISDLKGAFKYRHWLAHGRYWVPKLGRKYDYFSVFVLAQTIFSSLPFEGSEA